MATSIQVASGKWQIYNYSHLPFANSPLAYLKILTLTYLIAIVEQMSKSDEIRQQIAKLVGEYHEAAFAERPFIPGETAVPVSGRTFDEGELGNLVDASLDFWLTTGRYAADFERTLARYVGMRHALLCNSGSSANLLALTALMSPRLKERRLTAGDEIITIAAGFPTTVNPIIQNGLIPVFLDIKIETHNIETAVL